MTFDKPSQDWLDIFPFYIYSALPISVVMGEDDFISSVHKQISVVIFVRVKMSLTGFFSFFRTFFWSIYLDRRLTFMTIKII
jgi:hypothetical protein